MEQSRHVKGYVSGQVQGVGFRYFVMRLAQSENLHGYVGNLGDGRVEFLLQGEQAAVNRAIERIRVGPNYARVSGLRVTDIEDTPDLDEFVIRR